MTTRVEHRGACLCGAVRVKAGTAGSAVGACHCKMCRQWGGGPLLAVECRQDVVFEGTEHIAVFRSSEWAERGFCRECGTHLFFRLKQGRHYALPVGLLDDSHWRLEDQVFVDDKPPFYSFAQKTRDMNGEEVFAQYSAD